MLFKRKNKRALWKRALDYLWPKMGIKRTAIYYKHRVLRIPAGSHSIALGLAAGICVSWTPTFGTHLIQVFLFCLLFRANFFAGMLSSLIGNPWTFPALMWTSYQVGVAILSLLGFHNLIPEDDGSTFFENFGDTPFRVYTPTLIGGYILAVGTFPFVYFPLYFMVKTARKTRAKLKLKRQQKK